MADDSRDDTRTAKQVVFDCLEGLFLDMREDDPDGDPAEQAEDAREALWCNARDDKPREYFAYTTAADLDLSDVEEIADNWTPGHDASELG